METGKYCDIAEDFIHGEHFKCGSFVCIEPDVVVGDNVKLGNHVVLKSGTRFKNQIDFADYCKTTGLCIIGNNVNVRTGACISKSVIVEDKAFIGPGIMTNHTRNVGHQRSIAKVFLLTRIRYASIIGSTVSIRAGMTICANAIVGAGAVVVKDLMEPGVYMGYPAVKTAELPEGYFVPGESAPYMFSPDDINKYLQYLKV